MKTAKEQIPIIQPIIDSMLHDRAQLGTHVVVIVEGNEESLVLFIFMIPDGSAFVKRNDGLVWGVRDSTVHLIELSNDSLDLLLSKSEFKMFLNNRIDAIVQNTENKNKQLFDAWSM